MATRSPYDQSLHLQLPEQATEGERTISLNIMNAEVMVSFASLALPWNDPPVDFELEVTPSTAFPLKTVFRISAEAGKGHIWQDDNLPLRYQFFYVDKNLPEEPRTLWLSDSQLLPTIYTTLPSISCDVGLKLIDSLGGSRTALAQVSMTK